MAITVEFGIPSALGTTITSYGFLQGVTDDDAAGTTERNLDSNGETTEAIQTGQERVIDVTFNVKSGSTLPTVGSTLSYDSKTFYVERVGKTHTVGKITTGTLTARQFPKLSSGGFRAPVLT